MRYFLAREVPFGQDGDFSFKSFRNRFNSDLANDLGNLLNRTLSMLGKYFDGVIPDPKGFSGGLSGVIADASNAARESCDRLEFTRALESIWQMIGAGNKYINDSEPWTLAKNDKTDELAGVLYSALEVARAAAIMVSPFMPATAREIARQLGIGDAFSSQQWADIARRKAVQARHENAGPRPDIPETGIEEERGGRQSDRSTAGSSETRAG